MLVNYDELSNIRKKYRDKKIVLVKEYKFHLSLVLVKSYPLNYIFF